MTPISRLYSYDEGFFADKIPAAALYLPDPAQKYPLFIKRGVLRPRECHQLLEEMTSTAPSQRPESYGGNRVVQTYTLNGTARKIYKKAFKKVRAQVERFFRASLTSEMRAHGLVYSPGGHYLLHSDNCNPVPDDQNQIARYELSEPDRQFSTLIYLSDCVESITGPNQFTGGHLSFNYLMDSEGQMLTIKPAQGLMVSFPSHPIFSHMAHPVATGSRAAIVDWHSATYWQ